MLPVLVIVSLVAILILYWQSSNYWKKRNVREVNGTVLKFTFGNCSLPEYYKQIYDKYNENQIGFHLGASPALVLRDLQDVQAVLASNFQSFYRRGFAVNDADVLGGNMLFLDDLPRWKILRQKLSPAFSSLRLKAMYEAIEKTSRDFTDYIATDERAIKEPFDAVLKYTTASIGVAVFGLDEKGESLIDLPLSHVAGNALKPSLKANIVFFIGSTFPRLFRWLNMTFFGEYEDVFIGAVKKVLKNRRKLDKRLDIVDVYLDMQSSGRLRDVVTGFEMEPTDEVIAAQSFFFYVAGADTTANAIHFILLELSANPHVLNKLHAEIDTVLPKGTEVLTFEDIDRLTYMDMVISEAMRKYPPIGFIQRLCTKDAILPSNNLRISKDTVTVVPILAIHRDERFYPNPDVFDPERFTPENIKERNKFSYLAFGEGNRICIGARFSRLQMKACITWLLRKYTLKPQKYKPERFERSAFSLRDTKSKYEFIRRTN
ncbi:cytochrome P450 6B5-like [Bombyx mandarina]|uniref:unspecific monooxygenase n=1 Tax=Bombyx mandarina TaxID=7092 RepID=A0A6J2KE55_BOMMA|nr:cytochrome P450 6B5-like [Bombyx mandarina]